METVEISSQIRDKAIEQIKADSDKIYQLITVQLENLTLPQCPFYEDILDTQVYGLTKEIDFAVHLGLMEEREGKEIVDFLEKELLYLFEMSMDPPQTS